MHKLSRLAVKNAQATAASPVEFQFFPLRFEFVAETLIYFPPGKAGNMLRGALGAFSAPPNGFPDLHARIFEPVARRSGPSGLGDAPRPFVFRARHLDGCSFEPGESFYFDLHIFALEPEILAYFVHTIAAIVREGLGTQRGRADLYRVRRLAVNDLAEQVDSVNFGNFSFEPARLDLRPVNSAPTKIRVEFLSPTELKHDHRIAAKPEFPILFGRIRDRISTLRALYGPGPLPLEFRRIGELAKAVRMTICEIQRQEIERRSTRTGQVHSIGGFVGFAEYAGELTEFLPYLEAARWIGVGRHAVWGKGEIAVSV